MTRTVMDARWIRCAALPVLLAGVISAVPAHGQVRGGRAGAGQDTAGAGGAPSLRALVARDDSDLRVVRQRFDADRAALGRRYDIPLSPVLHARLRTFYDGWLRRLQELNARALDAAGRTDLAALRARIRAGLDTIAAEEREFAAFAPLLPFARAIQTLQERRRDRLDIDPLQAAETLNDVLKDVRRLTAAVERAAGAGRPVELGGVSAETASRAVRFLGALPPAEGPAAPPRFGAPPTTPTLRATLDSWYSFYHGYDPVFTWWARKPYEELIEALAAYSRAIQREWAIATDRQ